MPATKVIKKILLELERKNFWHIKIFLLQTSNSVYGVITKIWKSLCMLDLLCSLKF